MRTSTLGDVSYRFPAADEWTNLAYLVGLLAPLSVVERSVLGLALLTVCAGSWAWHRFESVLSRRFDELGMMAALSSVAFLLFGRILSQNGGQLGGGAILLSLLAWAFYYHNLHRTSSFHHIGAWASIILIEAVVLAGWLALIPVGLFAVALWGQFSLPWNGTRYEHGRRHGLVWHVGTGLAIASILIIC